MSLYTVQWFFSHVAYETDRKSKSITGSEVSKEYHWNTEKATYVGDGDKEEASSGFSGEGPLAMRPGEYVGEALTRDIVWMRYSKCQALEWTVCKEQRQEIVCKYLDE